jgi:hypothetical protein
MEVKRANKSKLLQVRLTPSEYDAVERMALRRNTTVSEAVRQVLWHATVSEALTPGPVPVEQVA